MAHYPQERAHDAVCQSQTGHMTGLWFPPTRPLRLNTMNECVYVCVCVYIYIHIHTHTHTHSYLAACRLYMIYSCYQTTLQWNIFTQIRVVRSVDWIFIVGAPVWRWLGQYVTLDKTFYSLLLKQEAVAALLLPYFVRLSFSSTRYLLEIQ